MNITFLTPRLPPSVCGVGDHTVQLAQAMRAHVEYVTAIDLYGETADASLPFDRIDRWDRRPETLSSLLRTHATDVLWIQYSGYGYGYQGVPRFLERALRRLNRETTLVAYFHQTHCRMRQLGWKGVLISPWQHRIAQRIAQRADVVFTSCELYRKLIADQYAVRPNKLFQLPIGSNIPVPVMDSSERQRLRLALGWSPLQRIAVVFGSSGSQLRVLRRYRDILARSVQSGLIHRIVCVGGTPESRPIKLPEVGDPYLRSHIVAFGHQSAQRVGEILLAADVGVTWCPFQKFGKSGVVMAYAAAGIPILVDGTEDESDLGFTGSFVHLCSVQDLKERTDCGWERRMRQDNAIASIGWPALASRAFGILNTNTVPVLES